jgi:ATP-dependent Clp protease ATP-binding subunit ClpB
MKRAIQHMISDPLALAFLDGRFVEGDTVRVDVGSDGALAFERAGA